MKTSFFKRQSTWVCLMVAGLAVIAFSIYRFKPESILPLLKFSLQRDTVTNFNLGFETVSYPGRLADGWLNWGYSSYTIKVDSVVKHSGKYALRIESNNNNRPASEFGCLARSIPAIYAGQKITVKAFMRTEDVDQPIGLMLRIDGKSGCLRFDNMQQRGITGSDEWEEYAVTLPLPDRAETIYIGALLSGKGKLWVDDFQVLIDDEDLSIAEVKKVIRYKAEADTEFEKGSKIKIRQSSPQIFENLEVLGRVWGFLKYYHPAVATGDYNWDAELFRIMPSIIDAKDKDERNQLLVRWINRLGKVKTEKRREKDSLIVVATPDFAWMDNPVLSKTLSQKLKEIKDARRNKPNYYIANNSDSVPDFLFENAYKQSRYDDDGMCLLALFRFWNIVQYFYPYRDKIAKDWDTALSESIPKFINCFSSLDYKQSILDLIHIVNEPYANAVFLLLNTQRNNQYIAPYQFVVAEDKLVVKDFRNEKAGLISGLQKGDIIVEINGKPIKEILNPAVYEPTVITVFGGEYLFAFDNQKTTARIIRNGKSQTCEISYWGLTEYLFDKKAHQFVRSDIGYVIPGYLKNDSLPEIMATYKDTKALIIDLRHTLSNDSLIQAFASYFLPQPVDYAAYSKTDFTNPGKFSLAPPLTAGKENNDYYKGKVVILVNDASNGFAETLSMALRAAPNAKVIGNASYPGFIRNSLIVLPGNVQTMFTGVGFYTLDSQETKHAGIKVDFEVKPTIKALQEGRDELIEKALEIIL